MASKEKEEARKTKTTTKKKRVSRCIGGCCYIFPVTDDTTGPPVPTPSDDDTWTVYGADWCGFCKGAKRFLETAQESFVYHDVDDYHSAGWVRKYLEPLIGDYSTVPLVFHRGEFIGGFTELKEKYKGIVLMSQVGRRVGGMTEVKEMNDEVVALVSSLEDRVRERLAVVLDENESKEGTRVEFEKLVPLDYATQLVAGVNYFVRLQLDDSEHVVHVRIYQPLPHAGAPAELVSLVLKGVDDSLVYF